MKVVIRHRIHEIEELFVKSSSNFFYYIKKANNNQDVSCEHPKKAAVIQSQNSSLTSCTVLLL